MKTRNNTILWFLSVAFVAMALVGCKETKIEPVCFPWAPANCTLSETDYNSPVEIHDYFANHDSTKLVHDGDTLKFWGWVYDPTGTYEPRLWDPHLGAWAPETGFIVLVPNEDHHGYDDLSIRIIWEYTTFLEDHPGFSQDFDRYLQKKWYVKAKVVCHRSSIWRPCSRVGIDFYVVDIDTIPNN